MVEVFVEELSRSISAKLERCSYCLSAGLPWCFTYIVGRLANVTERDGNRNARHFESEKGDELDLVGDEAGSGSG